MASVGAILPEPFLMPCRFAIPETRVPAETASHRPAEPASHRGQAPQAPEQASALLFPQSGRVAGSQASM